jgi:hypothetical protein
MRTILTLTCRVLFVGLTLVTATLALAQRPNAVSPVAAAGFGVCDGWPCFMGIVPGQTSWETTLRTLLPYLKPTTLTSAAGSDGVFEVGLATGRFGTLAGAYAPPDYLEFEPASVDFPTFGEFVLFYGEPCYVRIIARSRWMVRMAFFYPDLALHVVTTPDAHITPHHRVEVVLLTALPQACTADLERGSTAWHGFAQAAHYR